MKGLFATLFADRFPLPWQMSVPERLVLLAVLQNLKPAVAIELGAADGGSLQVITAYAGQVYSLDTDPTTPDRLGHLGATFGIGDSAQTFPALLDELRDVHVPFILIDGNHARAAVRQDIQALFRHRPIGRTFVLFHDSFNPDCRAGIREAGWEACPWVTSLELDFAPGVFHNGIDLPELASQMWGGFALAILDAEDREGPLTIRASQDPTFREIYRASVHAKYGSAL